MITEQEIETAWSTRWSYHLIGYAQWLRSALIERCGEDWLDAYQTRIGARDAALQAAYVEAHLKAHGRSYYLRPSYGSTWHLSGRAPQGKWLSTELFDTSLKENLERFFAGEEA